jgi:hypothetical protein
MALSDLEGLLDIELVAAAPPASGGAAVASPPAAAISSPASGQAKPAGLDDAAQASLAAAVVERLGDASADVASQAVKW